MFEAFYKLSDNPFRLTPDTKFCFRHPGHDQAYAYLQYALRLGEGFIMVTGRPGIGKTTLAQVFLAELEYTEVVAARVASVNVEAADLMRVVAYAYGIDVEGLDKATILVRLRRFFVEQKEAGKRVLLIVDEAQGLPYPALEELRLLADLQMDSLPLLQLFLVGQEKLLDLMQEQAMEQFQQRVIGACHLEPLSLTDTRDYIEHRLRRADWKGDPELTGEALLAIYKFSTGIPRHINKMCTRLLLDGFMEEKHKLDRDDVLEVADALRAERLAPMGGEAATAGAEDPASVPELENGTLELAELALCADPQQSPLPAGPVTTQAGSGMVSGRSADSGQPVWQRPRPTPSPAADGFRHAQRRRPERVSIPAWKPDSTLQLKLWNRYFANAIDWIKDCVPEGGRPGVWAGALAFAMLAITLLPESTEEKVGSHHSVMLEEHPEAASVTIAADEALSLTAHAGDYKEFEPASPESFEDKQDKPLELQVVAPSEEPVIAPLEPGLALSMSRVDRGSIAPDDAEPSPGDRTGTATSVAETAQDVPEEPAPAAARPSVIVASSRSVADAADGVQTPVPPVEQEDTAMTEQAVVTDSKVEMKVAVVEVSRVPEPVSREDRIIELLSLAQRALRSDRLLIPEGNNAYQYYQQVLELEPGNNAALFGIDQIVERYVSLGRDALDRQDKDKAERYIARGSRILPGDSRLVALQDRMSISDEPEIQVEVQPLVVETTPEKKDLLSWLKEIFGEGRTTDQAHEVPVEDFSY